MYFLYKNEYRILNLLNHHKKGTKGERRKIEEMNLSILVIIYIKMYIILYVYIYIWKCHKETPCIMILNKKILWPVQACPRNLTGSDGR
jgi:hypothetical protein